MSELGGIGIQNEVPYKPERLYGLEDGTWQMLNAQKTIIKNNLTTLGLPRIGGIGVSSIPEVHPVEKYNGYLTLGLLGDDETCIAIMAGARKQRTDTGDVPVLPILLPLTPQGVAVLKDKQSQRLYTDLFWICDSKGFRPIKPAEPLPLDGIFTMYDSHRDFQGYEGYLATNERLFTVTEDKYRTKTILSQAGVNVPPGVFLRNDEAGRIDEMFAAFEEMVDTTDGFVVKGNHGSGGEKVRLFGQGNIAEARSWAQKLLNEGQDIIIEKRIIPLPVRIPRGEKEEFAPEESDYNLRVLTTLNQFAPRVVDAEIRFGPKGDNPINIHQGAAAARVGQVLGPYMVYEADETAIRATRALCQEVSSPREELLGFCGIDIITAKDGKAYVLEANSGAVGGFGTLTRLDRAPLKSIRRVLLPSTIPFLNRNYRTRPQTPSAENLVRMPIRPIDQTRMLVQKTFAGKGNEIKSDLETFYASATEKEAPYIQHIAIGFHINKDYENALEAINSALRIVPDSADYLANKAMVLDDLGRHEEAGTLLEQTMQSKVNFNVRQARLVHLIIEGKEQEAREVIREELLSEGRPYSELEWKLAEELSLVGNYWRHGENPYRAIIPFARALPMAARMIRLTIKDTFSRSRNNTAQTQR